MSRTDAALLLAARTDPAAFRELYERYAEPLHAFHQRRTADADAAYPTPPRSAHAWRSARPGHRGERARSRRRRALAPPMLRQRGTIRAPFSAPPKRTASTVLTC